MPKTSPANGDSSKKVRAPRTVKKTPSAKKDMDVQKEIQTVPSMPEKTFMSEKIDSSGADTSFDEENSAQTGSNSNILWIVLTIIFGLFFVAYLLYQYQPDVRAQVQNFLAKNSNGATQQQTYTVPVTIIYDLSEPVGVKSLKEKFLASLVDPQKGLKNTEIKDVLWLDANSAEAQKYIVEDGAKYLPVAALDTSIEQHPQFKDLKNYLEKKGDHYYFHLYPLKHLQTPPVDGGHQKGAALGKAQVVILEYASFTCPFCKEMEALLTKGMKDFPGKVALVYKHFDRKPFQGSPVDNLLDQASECANEQNKFWPMHDELFKDQEGFTQFMEKAGKIPVDQAVRKYLEGKTKTVGLNSKKFLACYDSKKYLKTSDVTTMEAIQYGVSGTPAFFINGKFYDGSFRDDKGNVDYAKFKSALQTAMDSAKK